RQKRRRSRSMSGVIGPSSKTVNSRFHKNAEIRQDIDIKRLFRSSRMRLIRRHRQNCDSAILNLVQVVKILNGTA
ncbi:hypothetical protein, partial [Shinella sp.]|uniref:hypothetical protein n=1 Tax=Shinella sp. TaxID=1870904 RepID=UPI0028AF1C4F